MIKVAGSLEPIWNSTYGRERCLKHPHGVHCGKKEGFTPLGSYAKTSPVKQGNQVSHCSSYQLDLDRMRRIDISPHVCCFRSEWEIANLGRGRKRFSHTNWNSSKYF
ncbi:hypothetical protein WA026_016848 [Henosepilachna vigintioctopunctata]|uniref:Uncharacterized protein n=1 Tax=Henosepilachna vigintioctopunctata TaxID=420089 RepID=A0AAW1U3G6_9CUCU